MTSSKPPAPAIGSTCSPFSSDLECLDNIGRSAKLQLHPVQQFNYRTDAYRYGQEQISGDHPAACPGIDRSEERRCTGSEGRKEQDRIRAQVNRGSWHR